MALIREYRDGLCMLHRDHQILYPSSHPYGFVVQMARFPADDGMGMAGYAKISAWCRERFDPDYWFENDYTFWFKRIDDAMEFKLRWL